MQFLIGLKGLDDSNGRTKLFDKLALDYNAEECPNFRLLRGLEPAYNAYIKSYLDDSAMHKFQNR